MSHGDGITGNEVVVVGVGNTLFCDDGVGVHVAELLRSRATLAGNVRIIDGGTLGLSLLPEVEDVAGLIVVDAAELGEAPGTVRVFEDAEMDRQLSGKKRSVHEVSVADLLAAATLIGRAPRDRALVTVQPQSTEWGLEPTPKVKKAINEAADAIAAIIERWSE